MTNVMHEPGTMAAVAAVAALAEDESAGLARADRLPDALVEASFAAGLYRLCLPTELGGLTVPLDESVRLIERLAAADGSLGWCTVVANAAASLLAGVSEDEARVVAADPERLLIAGGFAPTGRAVRLGETLRVSGRWALASGRIAATWTLAGAVPVDPDGAPAGAPIVTFTPAAGAVIVEDWDAIGLRASGSHTGELHDVTVPSARSTTLAGARRWSGDPLAAIPFFGLGVLVAAVPLGIAGRALRELAGIAAARTPMGQARPLAEDPVFQLEFARARGRWESARAGVLDQAAMLWRHALTGDVPATAQATATLAVAVAGEAAEAAVRFAHRAAGTAALGAGHVLTRCLLDTTVVLRHIVFGSMMRQNAARAFLDVA